MRKAEKSRRDGNGKNLDKIRKWEKTEIMKRCWEILLKNEKCWKGENLAKIYLFICFRL